MIRRGLISQAVSIFRKRSGIFTNECLTKVDSALYLQIAAVLILCLSPVFAQHPTSMGTVSEDMVKATQDHCQWTLVSSNRWASPWSQACEDAVVAHYQQQKHTEPANSPRTQPGEPVAGTSQPSQVPAAPTRTTTQGAAVSNPRPSPHSAQARTGATARAVIKPREAQPSPVFWLDLDTALAQGKSSQTLAAEVTARGIDMYFDDGDAEYLRLLGASDQLLSALHSARFIFVDYPSAPAKWQTEAAKDEANVRAVELQRPNDPTLHWLIGVALQFEQKPSDAISELRKAVSLKPDLACAHGTLAELLLGSGQKQEALSEARESVRLMPNVPAPHLMLGDALAMNGDPQAGIAEQREAVRVAPDYYGAHYALASGLLDQKNTDEAVHEFREAVQLNPNWGFGHFGLGRALYEKRDYDGAVFEFKEAVRMYPRNATIHTWLAAALLSAGQFEEAAAEAHTTRLYDPKDGAAKEMLAYAKTKLGGAANPVSGPQVVQTAQPTANSNSIVGTWTCQSVSWMEGAGSGERTPWSGTYTFDSGGTYNGSHNWSQDGTNVVIHQPFEPSQPPAIGQLLDSSHLAWTVEYFYGADRTLPKTVTSFTCTRPTPAPTAQPVAASTQPSEPASNHPPYDDKCIRLGPGTLGAVSFTNICSEPIDLKWCYRQHGAGGDWHCTVTPKLFPNHTLSSPSCYQCSYDGRAAAYLSSRNLMADLPSDAEVASWTGSGPPQSASNNSTNSGSSDGQRQWRFVNPSQNWDTLTFEIHGRNGDSTSDDFNDETPIRTITLKPGESWTEDCGGYFSLDIKWVLASSSDPQTDIYYASLVCYANNFVWNNNHNLREYAFPRQ